MKFQVVDTLAGCKMKNESLTRVHAPGLALDLCFDPEVDFMGRGTVGEVFRASIEHDKKKSRVSL